MLKNSMKFAMRAAVFCITQLKGRTDKALDLMWGTDNQ